MATGGGADGRDDIFGVSRRNDVFRTHAQGPFQLTLAASDGNHAGSQESGDADEHEADGAEPDDGYAVSRTHKRVFNALQHASQRLD